MVSGGGGGEQGEDQWSQGHLRCSQGCRRQDGFPGTDRLLKNKGQSRLAFLMLLTNSTPRITFSNVKRKTKFDREIEKCKNL